MWKTRPKLTIGILICISILIFMIVFGIIDLNLYYSKLQSNENASIGYNNESESYDISFEYDGKIIYKHTIFKNNQEPVSVFVNINKFKYEGNYYFPFYKKFSMQYNCSFSPTNQNNKKIEIDGSRPPAGKIEGKIRAEITGFCSIKKAKELSEDKAIDLIKKYLIDSLSK